MNFIKCILLTSLISLGGCIYINGCNSNHKEVEKPVSMTADSTSGKTLACSTQFGDIHITGSDSDTCQIEATLIARAATIERAQELIDNSEIVKDFSGNKLTIKPICNISKTSKETVGASFTITTSSDTSLNLNTSFGDIKINGITKSCTADTSFGDIRLKDCTGKPELNTSYGDVTLENIKCSEAKVNTSFGDIKLKGNELPEDFNCSLNTSYGDIRITNLGNFAGNVKMSTSFGDVKCDKPITVSGSIKKENLSGTIGNGKGSITADTSFGDISIK